MRARGAGSARHLRTALLLASTLFGTVVPGASALQELAAQEPPTGRAAVEALTFPELEFDPPEADLREVEGVPVLFLADSTLPLVSVFASFRGGYARFPRDRYAAGMALSNLLRYGGTAALAPDSVDTLLEHFAVQTTFGGGGGGVSARVNSLREHADTAVALLGDLLRNPRFDREQIETWRLREIEAVRRRADNPSVLAVSEFNRLLYGDHPIGWEMGPRDLEPERLDPAVFRFLHRRIVCPDNLVLGVTGQLTWEEARALLGEMLEGWAPCEEELPPTPVPEIRREPGVFLVPKELEQSVVVMAHPSGVREDDDAEYYGALIGNGILGAGGFSSRILSRVRTEEGYAYSASSLWTTPRRWDGLVGAVTQTRPETAVEAARLILEILEEARAEPPSDEEVGIAVDRIVNGFVFNFERPAQIVARRMYALTRDLPADWLERYLEGIQAVTPASVHQVYRDHLRPESMSILVVGDPARMELEQLGEVTVLEAP
jgi:predicted Zn-dependent peptidase